MSEEVYGVDVEIYNNKSFEICDTPWLENSYPFIDHVTILKYVFVELSIDLFVDL